MSEGNSSGAGTSGLGLAVTGLPIRDAPNAAAVVAAAGSGGRGSPTAQVAGGEPDAAAGAGRDTPASPPAAASEITAAAVQWNAPSQLPSPLSALPSAASCSFTAAPTTPASPAAAARSATTPHATAAAGAAQQPEHVRVHVQHIPGGLPALLVMTAACTALAADAAGRVAGAHAPGAGRACASAGASATPANATGTAAAGGGATAAAATPATLAPAASLSSFPWPLYLVGTRDSFTYHLVPRVTVVRSSDGRTFKRTEYFFREDELPPDYRSYAAPPPRGLLPVGVITYTQLFSAAELGALERETDRTDVLARAGLLPPDCQHSTYGKGGGGAEGEGSLKRTKLFFGARYLWTREQLASPNARVAGGVRVDVPPPLRWMRQLAESPLVGCGVIPRGFVDSVALNLYHDGSEGIQSHYDDAARFRRPIYSVRLFSDSRLSFGGSLFGTTNNAFFVPMPRGCVTVLEEASFAANGIKHCVRPVDMAGKSAALILRGIEPEAMRRAKELFVEETCERLQHVLRIVDGPTASELSPLPRDGCASASAPEDEDTLIRRVVRSCLTRAVEAVEAAAQRESAAAARLHRAGTKLAVTAVVRRMVWRVARAAAREQCGLPAAQPPGAGPVVTSRRLEGAGGSSSADRVMGRMLRRMERQLDPTGQQARPHVEGEGKGEGEAVDGQQGILPDPRDGAEALDADANPDAGGGGGDGCGGGTAAAAAVAAADDAAVAADGALNPAAVEEQWHRWREARVLRAATRLAVAGAELGGPELRRAVRQILRVDGFRMLRWLRRHREAALAAGGDGGGSSS
ncbi:hypothetical protein GPECTOR_1g845 [Gonium pectorale]|uniref:Uncharacterized protein n=1 Tax=Gonium pectorale TaxID=33097 RepID=A0A150H465_GONPE|nr:hypothetical protein GPECTOR_1g845 [Gonium pectorale]|eukprot:KXZ56937.1 hypothetical protein GPECTOR_1g845 [Gonium pectorale]